MSQPTLVRCRGHGHLRQRLVLSLLSGKPVRIDGIRPEDKNPGLRGMLQAIMLSIIVTPFADYEVSLLRLLDKLTNGTVVEISVTGELQS